MSERPDKSRYYLIFLAVVVINMITSSIFTAQSLLFVDFIEIYEVDRKIAAIPFSIRAAIRNLAAPFIGLLGQKYGIPAVTVFGGVLGSLSSALCYFSKDIVWMSAVWGGINGFTLAMINVCPLITITQYFAQHGNIATGLLFSVCPISALVTPAFLEFLLETYGLNGTFLILAGLFLHVIPAGMLLKKHIRCNDTVNDVCNDVQKLNTDEKSHDVTEEENTNVRKYRKASTSKKKRDFGIQVGTDKMYDFSSDQKVLPHAYCKYSLSPLQRSHSQGSLMVQAHLNNLQLTTMFPRVSSIELNCRTFSRNPENIYDVDIDYLKRRSDLVFHLLSMEIPNVEVSCRAILLEMEQDDLWHPEQNEILQEIESIYRHIEKSFEINEISFKTGRPDGPHLRRTLLNGALSINKKSESLRAVKKYLKTYKERGLQQLGKIRSAPNMSNIYNEIARKDYVLTKLKELCNGNEIRIISQLSQFNPKDVLRVLFQLRTLYDLYSDLDCCDKRESEDRTEIVVETGDICSDRKVSWNTIDFDKSENVVEKLENVDTDTFQVKLKTIINLNTKLKFWLVCCTQVAYHLSFISMYITLIDFGRDKNFKIKEGKYIIGVLSIGDLIGCLGLGWITDKGYASVSQFMLAGMMLQGAALSSIPVLYAKWTYFTTFLLIGLLQGSLHVKHPFLITTYFKPQEQPNAVEYIKFLTGILLFLLPIYIGYLRDNIGSYDPMYYANGAFTVLVGIAWFFERCFLDEKEIETKK